MKTLLPSRAFPALPAARAAAPPARGVRVEGVEPAGRPNAGNAALFVGVNEFEDTSLRALRFAVNDSVAQAHLFVLELKLIPPANTVVLLSGEPGTTATRAQLAALKDAGVRVERASRSKMFTELLRAVAVPQETADLIVVSLSSHGFEHGGVPYVLPFDGLRGALAHTGFSLKEVEDQLGRSKAGKRLLIVDACREMPTGDDKSTGGAMERAWRAALAQASGQAVLASCDVGQFSYEDVKLGHGVFTYYLLEALGGKAPADDQGFITLGAVSDHVARAVSEWVRRNKVGSVAGSAQRPWFKGPTDARDIPLAISTVALGLLRDLPGRLKEAMENLSRAGRVHRMIIPLAIEREVAAGLRASKGSKLNELLEQLEDLSNVTAPRARAFIGWWKEYGRVLAERIPPEIKGFAAIKEAEARKLVAEMKLQVAPEYWDFFSAARQGNLSAATNLFEGLRKRAAQYEGSLDDPTVASPAFQQAIEVELVLEGLAETDWQQVSLLGSELMRSIPATSILFGGTDPGRGLTTALSRSHGEGDPFFTITQNALASAQYMAYLRWLYGAKLALPDVDECANAFSEYVSDTAARREHDVKFPNEPKQLKDGEVVQIIGGKYSVSGQTGVMGVNALIAKRIFDKNPKLDFYVEESFPLDWMYPHLTPHRAILKLNRERQEKLPAETVKKDREYWDARVRQLLGKDFAPPATIADACEFVKRCYVQRDLKGFGGDTNYLADSYVQTAVSKLRSAIGGVYIWRVNEAAKRRDADDNKRMHTESHHAFLQAFVLCPKSSEAVYRYTNLLISEGRMGDALSLTRTALSVEPENDSFRKMIKQLEDQHEAAQRFEALMPSTKVAELIAAVESGKVSGTAERQQVLVLLHTWAEFAIRNSKSDLASLKLALQAYSATGAITPIEDCLHRILMLTPKDPEAWYDLAAIQAYQKKHTEALGSLRNAVLHSSARQQSDPTARDLRRMAKSDPRFTELQARAEFERILKENR